MTLDEAKTKYRKNCQIIEKFEQARNYTAAQLYMGQNIMLEEIFGKENLIPKESNATWSKLYNNHAFYPVKAEISEENGSCGSGNYVLSRSALALFRIYQVIERSYGGVPTSEMFADNITSLWVIMPRIDYEFGHLVINLNIVEFPKDEEKEIYPILVFKKHEYAEKFIQYGENLKLIREFFMISSGIGYTERFGNYNKLESEWIEESKNLKC